MAVGKVRGPPKLRSNGRVRFRRIWGNTGGGVVVRDDRGKILKYPHRYWQSVELERGRDGGVGPEKGLETRQNNGH